MTDTSGSQWGSRSAASRLTEKTDITGSQLAAEQVEDVIGGHAWRDLFGAATDALRFVPPAYISSLFGLPWEWAPFKHHHFSESAVVNVWRPRRALSFLLDAFPPFGAVSVPKAAPPYLPPLVQRIFWHSSRVFQTGDHYGRATSYPDESWFFINGIMANEDMSRMNSQYLAYLFHRPITVIHNVTGGLVEDLYECARDKATALTGEAATRAFPALYDALKDPSKRRVVLIAHSQGTIIASVVLRFMQNINRYVNAEDRVSALEKMWEEVRPQRVNPEDSPLNPLDFQPLRESELAKLEVYCFANCATQMRYIVQDGRRNPIPYIESYGNERDFVARLGMLAPQPARRGVRIDGPKFVRRGGWGHFLNDHYLRPIENVQKRGRKRGPKVPEIATPFVAMDEETRGSVPRLYHYINGGSPPDRG